jgi:simple sugar transport system permease protein
LRDPQGYNFPKSKSFPDNELLPILFDGTRLHIGLIFTGIVVVLAWFVMSRTLVGFRIKVMGLTPVAGGYAGFSQKLVIWLSFLISGGLAGLAGVIEVTGPIGQLQPGISPGYGFTAIIVAFLGRLHPLGIALASMLVALSYLGGESVQMQLHLPIAVTGVFQGLLLFFLLAADVLIRYRLRWVPSQRRIAE